ncbi:MAG: hypothetical protein ACREXY_07740 [Gammaproteobacteria bacterium]|jgi:hypothetical protein
MRGIEGDDSEMAYRRGYEHGVIEMSPYRWSNVRSIVVVEQML